MKRLSLAFLAAAFVSAQPSGTLNPPCVSATVNVDRDDPTEIDVWARNNCNSPYTLKIGLKYMYNSMRVAESMPGDEVVFQSVQPQEQISIVRLSDWQNFTTAKPTPMIREIIAQ